MGALGRGTRVGLVGTAALATLVLVSAPAPAQTTSTTAPPGVEPTEVVDVEDFENRAQRWAEARRRAREQALRRAEELAIANRSTTSTTTISTTTTTTSTTTTTTTEPPTTSTEAAAVEHPIPAGTTEEQWHALRQCESTQNYRAVSVSGRYRGAYQFSIRTWDWVAGMHYPDLVGVDPRDASPSDQDKMAYKLYEINGWDPWPTCKKRLPS
ncbi:MAG: transglycosylase family protein [Acidimicrobiia bacterium]|nr:transglycosylase family protein [Acidimicrobiia bacterium]